MTRFVLTASSLVRSAASFFAIACAERISYERSASVNSAISGTAISAAFDGVDARASAT